MRIKGALSETMKALRGNSKGQITDLTNGFKLKGNHPFYILITPAAVDGEIPTPEVAGLQVNCTAYQDDNAGPYGFTLMSESVLQLVAISPDAIDLDKYDVYWSSGVESVPAVIVMGD